MKKYFVIDTWNGEGYSDSKVVIREIDDVVKYMKGFADGCIGSWDDEEENGVVRRYPVENPLRYEYSIGDDDGAVELIPFSEDVVGVIVIPNVNDNVIINSFQDMDNCIELVKGSEDYEEDGDEFGVVHHCMDDGKDWILFEIQSKEDALINGVKELLSAVDNNLTRLWHDDLNDKSDCIILSEETIYEGDADNGVQEEYTGISKVLDKLQSIVGKTKEE